MFCVPKKSSNIVLSTTYFLLGSYQPILSTDLIPLILYKIITHSDCLWNFLRTLWICFFLLHIAYARFKSEAKERVYLNTLFFWYLFGDVLALLPWDILALKFKRKCYILQWAKNWQIKKMLARLVLWLNILKCRKKHKAQFDRNF